MSSLKRGSRTKSLSLGDDFPLKAPSYRKRTSMPPRLEDTLKIMKYIDENVIGKGAPFLGPFGRRRVVFADYSSSGRSLQFIEDYINREILPAFGDIGCTSSVTGLQSMIYNKESRDIIKNSLHATDDDEIIFCSNPSERMANLFTSITQKNFIAEEIPTDFLLDDEIKLAPKTSNVVLFVSITEPISTLKPWMDAGVQIEKVAINKEGFIDLDDLEKQLAKYSESKQKLIGLFPGVSRLTGILSDDVATTILLHQYGALSLWNYNLAISSAPIDTNPPMPGAAKDAVFFNGNKLIGGVQAPGILVIKKCLIENHMSIHQDTVNTVSIVRGGLIMQLKETLGAQAIMIRTEKICKQMLSHIRTIPEIVLLGPACTTTKRVSTMCFLVRHPRGAFLHHKFVVAVLNDVFGIQASAENLMDEILGISGKLSVEYEKVLNDESMNAESIRPGYVRVTLPFFMSESEVNFILEALKMVATEAWKLLPQYHVDDLTGEWKHYTNMLAKERKSLSAVRYTDGRMLFSDRRISGCGAFPQNYSDCLQFARNSFNRARKIAQRSSSGENLYLKYQNDNIERLRWFMLPGEAHELLLGHSKKVKISVPFDPHVKSDSPSIINMLRHNSLSALDVCRLKSRSLTGTPFIRAPSSQSPPSQCSSPTPMKYPECASPPIVRFSLGGEVTFVANLSPPQIANLIASETTPGRTRCHSWGPTGDVKLCPHTRNNLGNNAPKKRSCSCSSQTDLNIQGSSESLLHNRKGSMESNGETIHELVKGVTKEIASEIKSEIQEVISQVDDILEISDTIDVCNANLNSINSLLSVEEKKSDIVSTVSTEDVVEYLREFSKDLTSEVKSEIREAANAVDEFISPDSTTQGRKNSPNDSNNRGHPNKTLVQQRYSDVTYEKRPKIQESDRLRSESFPQPNNHSFITAPSPEHSTPLRPYTGAISKLIDPKETSSQDSGINLCFQDHDERHKIKWSSERNRAMSTPDESDESESQDKIRRLQSAPSDHNTSENEMINSGSSVCSSNQSPKVLRRQPNLVRASIDTENDENSPWHNLPKEIWKKAAEAIDEFDMIKDGDKILVCVSGSSSSTCLIHGIRQFSKARGLRVELGAVTIADNIGVDPRCLMLHMKTLEKDGVEYIFEQGSANPELLENKLSMIAHRRGYNTLALAHTLDQLADDFLASLLVKGRLHVTPAYKQLEKLNIKIICPFIYVRRKLLEEFCSDKNIPSRPAQIFIDGVKSILTVQEVINPKVFENIKSALKPLLCLRMDYLMQPIDNDEIMEFKHSVTK